MALIFLKKIWNGLQMMRKYEIKSPLTGWSINWRNKWIRQRSRRPLFRIIRPGNCFLSFSNLISFFNKPFNSRILKKLQWNYKSQFEIIIKKWKNCSEKIWSHWISFIFPQTHSQKHVNKSKLKILHYLPAKLTKIYILHHQPIIQRNKEITPSAAI